MVNLKISAGLSAALLFGSTLAEQQVAWGQCGGKGWSGPTDCVAGYHCTVSNEYYSQCLPGAASITSPITTKPTATTLSTKTTSKTNTLPPVITTKPPTGTGTNPGPTLVSGWSYIRAVASPNFHSYLQSQPTGLPSLARLDSPDNAGQFNVIDGQLVYNTGAGGKLYMNVENPADKTQRKLETKFAKEKNAYGTFAFQGDTLTWHTDDIKRPNEAAWLVCAKQQVFVNTGAYGYMTPEGCSDQTIHGYGGSTPNI